MVVDEEGFSGTRTAQVVGISYRQLDYWARTNLIRPSLADATGSGSRRRYSYRDLLELKVVKKLIDAGIRLESVREVFTYLPRAHEHRRRARPTWSSPATTCCCATATISSPCCSVGRASSTCCPWPG